MGVSLSREVLFVFRGSGSWQGENTQLRNSISSYHLQEILSQCLFIV